MREIKFRAWDMEKDKMRTATAINWYDEYIWVDETPMSGDRLPIESTPLMQYTGLKDKNGKEIYEGDIVKIKVSEPFVVKFDEKLGQYFAERDSRTGKDTLKLSGIGFSRSEIIGNNYENKELLNQ